MTYSIPNSLSYKLKFFILAKILHLNFKVLASLRSCIFGLTMLEKYSTELKRKINLRKI